MLIYRNCKIGPVVEDTSDGSITPITREYMEETIMALAMVAAERWCIRHNLFENLEGEELQQELERATADYHEAFRDDFRSGEELYWPLWP